MSLRRNRLTNKKIDSGEGIKESKADMTITREGSEAQKYVWEGAIPLQIHLHESEVTTSSPPPASALILAPRIGYLPLLVPQIKPFFCDALPPGEDTVWFEYKGLPLKWYIPTGVLFDILCAEPERPWNLTVHFRGYPVNFLTPCENEDSVKWSFINSLKEADYVINGNCKSVMNMSQNDQLELWRSILDGNLETYLRVSHKLKFEIGGDEKLNSSESPKNASESDSTVPVKAGRIPVRLYVVSVEEDFDDLEDAPQIDGWDNISYINRPVEIHGEGNCFTLLDAVKTLLPEFFKPNPLSDEADEDGEQKSPSTSEDNAEIKLLRIQGIEPKFEIPFVWVVNNLMNPEHFLHICVYIRISETVAV